MKRYILAASLLILGAALFAQGKRTVEFGVDANAAVSNNYFSVFDFWNDNEDKTLVLDFGAMAEELGKSALVVSADAGVHTFFNLNLSKDLKMGVFFDVSAYAYGGIPGELLSILGEGNAANTVYNESFDVKANSWASMGAKLYMRTGKLGIGFVPSYFMPLAIARESEADITFYANSSGEIRASGDLHVPIYSAVPLDEMNGLGTSEMANLIFANGGLDFTLSADYQLTDEWKLAASLENIPILPARLQYLMEFTASFDYEIQDLAQQLMDNTLPDFTYTNANTFSSTEIDDVWRAFKLRASALYTPLWFKPLSAEPMLGVGINDGIAYIDFGLKTKLNLANIFIVKAEASRRERIWYQEAGFILNAHVLELEVLVGMSSASFLSSYTANGLYAMAGVRLGF